MVYHDASSGLWVYLKNRLKYFVNSFFFFYKLTMNFTICSYFLKFYSYLISVKFIIFILIFKTLFIMKELTRVETSNLIGGDQCKRLKRRYDRAFRQGRKSTGRRLFAKWEALDCAMF